MAKTKTKGKKHNLSSLAESFLGAYEFVLNIYQDKNVPKITVNDVIGSLARVYERIRTTVEYKSEHVLRRNAIERILKRRLWVGENINLHINTPKVAESVIKELIWARYLPNHTIPEKKVQEVETIIEKYLYLSSSLSKANFQGSIGDTKTWIWGVASSEIEDALDPSYRQLYVRLMYEWFMTFFDWADVHISGEEKQIQAYIAIHRALVKSDDSIIRYHLLLSHFPQWKNADKPDIDTFILKFEDVYKEIEGHLKNPITQSVYRRIQRQSPPFDIFREIARKERLDLRKLLQDKTRFEAKVKEVCDIKYKEMRTKIARGTIRSIIYIFLTKVFLAFLIEVPYEVLRYGDIRYIPLATNIAFPPFLMWLIGLSLRTPGEKNTQEITARLSDLVYRTDLHHDKVGFSVVKKRTGGLLTQVFGLVYLLLLACVFGLVTYILLKINFTILGIMIFFFFLSLVLLFVFRIRYNANQLKVDSDTEGFLAHLVNYLTLPFLNLGLVLSRGLSKLNFLAVILDFLIEAPFKSIINVFEEWISYIREKRDEVVELPE